MTNRILIFLSFLCVLVPTHASNPGDMLLGKWKVVTILDSAPVTSLSDAQAKRAIGEYVIITKKAVRFQEEIGLSPVFTESKENTFDVSYHGYRTDPVNPHLSKTVTVVDIKCENVIGINEIYIQNKNSIIFYWEGFFYKAVRAK